MDITVKDQADALVAMQAWAIQVQQQAAVDDAKGQLKLAQEAVDARETALENVCTQVRLVMAPVIERAGGTLPDGSECSALKANDDGTVTISTTP